MLTVSYQLASGDSGQHTVGADERWVFGRGTADVTPQVVATDPRISRLALVVRDSGPGPVLFRGQRGDAVTVRMLPDRGDPIDIPEGMAGNLTSTAHRAEMLIGEEFVIRIDVAFDARGSVAERQAAADDEAVTDTTDPFRFDPLELGVGPLTD